MLVKSYMTSYKLPCIITRGNNVYGPHQFPEKLIPKMTLLAQRGGSLPVHGDGQAVRSYLYVKDVARAFDIGAPPAACLSPLPLAPPPSCAARPGSRVLCCSPPAVVAAFLHVVIAFRHVDIVQSGV